MAGRPLACFGDADTNIQTITQTSDHYGPTLDPSPVLPTDAAVAESVRNAAPTAIINAFGNFINENTIAADGPTGSTLTIALAGTTITGTYVAGTFINYGGIVVDAGNTLDITIGATSDLLNAGEIETALFSTRCCSRRATTVATR